MSTTSPTSGVISLQRAIDHYFELALYLLVLTGFATLASTGGLDLPSVFLVGIGLAIPGDLGHVLVFDHQILFAQISVALIG